MLIGQLPGTEQALSAAANRGWEAVLLVVLIIATFTCFGWVMRRLMNEANDRESRLSERVTHLEEVIRTELLTSLRHNSEVMSKMLTAADSIIRAAESMTDALQVYSQALDLRPCLLNTEELVARIEKHKAKIDG